MSETEWTRGPWKTYEGDPLLVMGPEDRCLGDMMPGHGSPVSREEALANAKLVAAAPDLYEELEAALDTLVGCCIPGPGVDDPMAMEMTERAIKAALAKARGETA